MEVIIAVLSCALGFAAYLLHKNREEISELKSEIQRLRTKQIDNSAALPAVDENTFVSVIFKKNDKKYYDYLLGDVSDVHVGDFVEVYVSNKFDDELTSQLLVAQVIYISVPGEVSEYAKSKIKRKSARRKW